MAINTVTMGDLLVRVYDKGTVTRLQNLEVPFLSYFGEARDFTVGGRGLYFAVNPSGDEGYGFIDENSPIPTPQNEQTLQAIVNPTVFAGAVRITGLGRSISNRDPHAFASGLQYHMDYKLRRMTVYQEGAMFRDGTGALCQLAGSPGASTVTTAFPVDNPGTQWLRRNMLVDVKNTSNVTIFSNVKITESDFVGNGTNGTLLTDVDIQSAPDNSTLYLAGTQPASGTPVERELLGLDAGIDTTGTYLSIPRGSVPEWESNIVDAGSTSLDEDRLLQAENRVLIIGGLSEATIRAFRIVVHPNQRRKYFEIVVPQKQFTGLALDAGYSKLTWNGHEMVATYNCPETKAYMGDFSMFQKFTAPDGEMKIDTSFGPPVKWAQGFDAGIAYWRAYCNYAMRKPNSWVRIDNLLNVTNR